MASSPTLRLMDRRVLLRSLALGLLACCDSADNFDIEVSADTLQRQTNTVFFDNNCSSAHGYYFDKHGDAPFLRPASGLEMWWRSRHFPLRDYHFDS